MPPRIWPENPVFVNEAERVTFEHLYAGLGDKAVIFTNLKFYDIQEGDIEIDLVALIEGLGAVVIETKGGSVSYNGQKWLQASKEGSHEIDPHTQVIKNMYAFRNFLRNRWRYGNLKVEWLIALPESLVGRIHIPNVDRERILDRAEIAEVATRACKVLSARENSHQPRERDWVEKAFDAVRGHATAETDRDAFLDSNYLYVKQITHERKMILDLVQDNQRIYVHGPAGSGKSWLAFEQAVRWRDQGLRVGIAVFNRGLASYMKRKADEIDGEIKFGFVGTIHELAGQLGSTQGDMDGFYKDYQAFKPLIQAGIDALDVREKFDAWVVDEVQDFNDELWHLIYSTLKNSDSSRIAIYGDPDQAIYSGREIPTEGFAQIRLNENLRNSQEISLVVDQIVGHSTPSRGPHGFDVEFVTAPSADQVLDFADDVVERLTDQEVWNPGEIALLTTKYRHPVHEDQSMDSEKYWKDFWNAPDVFYGTVQGFKGLERSVVVLAINGIHDSVTLKDVMYVGMTRARDRLVIVGTAETLGKIQITP